MRISSNLSQNQNINFSGEIDLESTRLARKIGTKIYNGLQAKAKEFDKNTILSMEEQASNIGPFYPIYIRNPKLGVHVFVDMARKEDLPEAIERIKPSSVAEDLVRTSIRYIKKNASCRPINDVSYKILKREAKENLRIQREFGIKKPFWAEAKKSMVKADICEDLTSKCKKSTAKTLLSFLI